MGNRDRSRIFDSWAQRYDDSVACSGDSFPLGGYRRVLEQVVSQAGADMGMSVLDLGVGTGNLAARFAALGCEVWGVDFSRDMLVKARAKLPGIHLVCADLLDQWPGDLMRRFDRIVSAYVLHEFDLATKMQLLERLASERLAVGGRIVIGDIAFPTGEARKAAHTRWAERWDEEEHYWAADEAITAGARAGLHLTCAQVSHCGAVFVIVPMWR